MRKGSKVRRSMSTIMLAVALAVVSICGNVTTSDAAAKYVTVKQMKQNLKNTHTVKVGKTEDAYSDYSEADEDVNHDGIQDYELLTNKKIKILTAKKKWSKKVKVKIKGGNIKIKGLKKGRVTLKLKCSGSVEQHIYNSSSKVKKTIKKNVSYTAKLKIKVKEAKKKTTKKKTTETEETEATPTPEPTETPAPEEEEVDYGETPAPTDAN